MKNIQSKLFLVLASIAASILMLAPIIALNTGCMTTTGTSTNSLGAVVTNTVVNASNLALDCAVIQSVAAATTTIIISRDKSATTYLQDYQVALGGIINGASSNSASQLVATFSKSPNATLTAEISPLVSGVSGLEQSLLVKYGTSIAGQIAIAIAKAVSAGIATAGVQ